MICPNCGFDNLPGNEECSNCQQALTPLDRPMPGDRVERSLMEDPVRLLDPKPAITISADTSIQSAIQAMLASDIGALLIVSADGKLQGIFSERDLLSKVAGQGENYASLRVGDYMTLRPETVTLKDTLAFALHKMDGGGYRHLPVVANDRPLGVISVRDIIRHITRLCKDH